MFNVDAVAIRHDCMIVSYGCLIFPIPTPLFTLLSGDITNRRIYIQILFLMLTVGLVTSVKRVGIGYLQGKRVFAEYGEEVASLMRKVRAIQTGLVFCSLGCDSLTSAFFR